MKRAFALPILSFILFVAFSCSKSSKNGNSNPPSVDSVALLKSELSGKWNVVKYVATNFLSNGGYISPNDTVIPPKAETREFLSDSIHSVTGEAFGLDATVKPYNIVTQPNIQLDIMYSYTVGKGYFAMAYKNIRDTPYVVSISSTQMETVEKISAGSGPYLYDLHTYYQR